MTNREYRELGAEFVGTFALVGAVCGAGLFSAPTAGLMAVAFAVGLAVMAMAFAVGHVSGGHFNPAVTLGLAAAGRFNPDKAFAYIVAQVAGGAAAALVAYLILKGAPAGRWGNFTAISNTYGGATGFTLPAVFLMEVVATALFLIVITGATSPNAPGAFAPIAIGVALIVIHLAAIPVSNASVNPARSTATALFGGETALNCLWAFWLAPIIGGAIGGYVSRYLYKDLPARILPRKPARRR